MPTTITVKYFTTKIVLAYKNNQRFRFTKRKRNKIIDDAMVAGYLITLKQLEDNLIICLDKASLKTA
ncbi:MAG: hypothetical protein WCL51_16910 [Bacteroidota bacterium]